MRGKSDACGGALCSRHRCWLNLLKLTRANHRKTFTKKGSEIQHSVLQYGVCAIGVNKVSVAQHIYGAIQEYGGFDKPEWLF